MVIMFLIISRLKLTKMIHIVSIEIVLCFGGKSQQTPNLRSGVCSIRFILDQFGIHMTQIAPAYQKEEQNLHGCKYEENAQSITHNREINQLL
ncbi:hypothetical protein SAMN06272722_102246 [Paenibacillus sp. RU5A]|nr:hypothetical protein SAMN06272722_102246 [Paenibacillus sp. RU5A]SOC67269.1 hypothetical protein SAMN05880581_102752 [Paenibacillus sp. RU26A]SOC69404.1 hypothetical protein SAMN05880586_102246 [Paenibacillus sp. RU5M]